MRVEVAHERRLVVQPDNPLRDAALLKVVLLWRSISWRGPIQARLAESQVERERGAQETKTANLQKISSGQKMHLTAKTPRDRIKCKMMRKELRA